MNLITYYSCLCSKEKDLYEAIQRKILIEIETKANQYFTQNAEIKTYDMIVFKEYLYSSIYKIASIKFEENKIKKIEEIDCAMQIDDLFKKFKDIQNFNNYDFFLKIGGICVGVIIALIYFQYSKKKNNNQNSNKNKKDFEML